MLDGEPGDQRTDKRRESYPVQAGRMRPGAPT
jgi:hypothetical protein